MAGGATVGGGIGPPPSIARIELLASVGFRVSLAHSAPVITRPSNNAHINKIRDITASFMVRDVSLFALGLRNYTDQGSDWQPCF